MTPALPFTLPISLFAGSTVAADVPGLWPAALNGMPLMIDDSAQAGWSHQGIQQIRTQADNSTSPAEASLNPQDLWRRAQESWHRGAGQQYRDRTNADEFRFLSSKGIDIWTPYQIGLLNDTDQKKTSSNTNLKLEPAGARLYFADGSTLRYTTDITPDTPTFTTVTGTAGVAITGLASDGFNVYIGSGASGIYLTDTTSGAAASWVTGTVNLVAYVKGRLMVSADNSIYNVTASGALPSPLFTHGNAAFTWVGFAEGTGNIFAAGYAGDKSLVYRIAVKADASSLDAPIVAGELPDGEVVRSIGGYLGFIFLGTDKGVRFCEVDGQGNLSIGPLIQIDTPVYCFEGQERFVWFGWTGYDSSSTGLGRMDLTEFTEDIITGGRKPAYASDLMATASGAVTSVVTFQNYRVFTASASGVWAQATTLVASGTISSGNIGFGLPDEKIGVKLSMLTEPLAGSYSADVTANGTTVTVGSESTANTTDADFPLNYVTARNFALTITLNRSSGDTTMGPTFLRWTMKVSPGASGGPAEYINVPYLMHKKLRLADGQDHYFDVASHRDAIKSLRENRTVVSLQLIESTYQVTVENYEWTPVGLKVGPDGAYRTEDGTMLVQHKRVT